jgi:GDPmannose 4,6-dehydratase
MSSRARKPRAIIVGSRGQDGQLLFTLLASSCDVVGIDVGHVETSAADRDALSGLPSALDIHDTGQVAALVRSLQPDEIYYLAARHHSAEERPDDASELHAAMRVNFDAYVNVLEAVRLHAPTCRVFYASSSHMFGTPQAERQDESTPLSPENPYAVSKVAGTHASRLYRARHGMHVSVGILYNHESPLRSPRFVSQKIAMGAKRASREANFKLTLASLGSVVDWGYAPDYVRAMTLLTRLDTPSDYIVATGAPRTVGDFVEAAFSAVGLDWQKYVVAGRGDDSSAPKGALVGDAKRLRRDTGWAPSVTFEEMVAIMVRAAP